MDSSSELAGVEQRGPFQLMEWRVQRLGWWVWGATLIAALLGVLGEGPLSRRRSVSADQSISVEYNRWVHYHHPTSVVFRARVEPTAEQLRLSVNDGWFGCIEIRDISPRPDRVELHGDEQVFVFLLDSAPPIEVTIRFQIEYEQFGDSAATVQLASGDAVSFQQFAYP